MYKLFRFSKEILDFFVIIVFSRCDYLSKLVSICGYYAKNSVYLGV